MKYLLISLVIGSLATPVYAGEREQQLVAERFVEALQGESDFSSSDFERPLDAETERYLARFEQCKKRYLRQPKVSQDGSLDNLEVVPDKFTIGLKCEGVPSSTPVGLTLHFNGDRISKIETHNADLMERGDG